MENNIMLLSDSYKMGHANMYPKGTENVYSYFESRNGAKFNKTVFFGLQAKIKEYLCGVQVTKEKINHAEKIINKHLGEGVFNKKGWEYILKEHQGKLPIEIKAVPEGTPIPTGNVLMTVVNTDPKCFWLTNFLETLLSQVWYSSTVATLSREIKIVCKHYLKKTSDNEDGLDFMLHDFGYRGATSIESAGAGGAGHLLNFSGTDTIRAIEHTMEYYDSDVCAFSVQATEHSVMTALGETGEMSVVSSLLNENPEGILSVVIDSYDYIAFIKNVAKIYKHTILNRNGKFVFRPDSGEPITTTLKVLDLLEEYFGCSLNTKGYKELPEQIGILWGDGIDYMGIRNILHAMQENYWAASNIVFGMGGGLLQKVDRDTQRFAFKCSAQKRNGEWYNIFKSPLDKSKESKKGKLFLYMDDSNKYFTNNKCDCLLENHLKTVFRNGELKKEYMFSDVRRNAKIW